MKFYYNLSYNLLPSYFNYYLEVINNAFPCQYELRQIARPLIRPQRTRLVFTELNVLFQLIQLLIVGSWYMTVCSVVLCFCCQSVLLVVLAGGLSLVHELSSRSFCCRVRMIWW